MTLPRILVLVGSGETAAQMQRGYRMLVERLVGEHGRPADVRAAIIDTPYRFQENAAALSAELLDFFGRRIGLDARLAAYGRSDEDPVIREAALQVVREAHFVFSGPGSPSYALRQWQASEMPALFSDKLANGGVQVFASAAALTMGRLTMPVYELYKGGADPYWLTGLDLLGALGINASVLPHYDNGDGGDHDTRFCFLGERRLRALEEQMDAATYVLGIDEHTALMLDIDQDLAMVHGRGSVTIRERDRSEAHPAGAVLPLAELRRSVATAPPAARLPTSESAAHIAEAASQYEATGLARRLLEVEQGLNAEQERSKLVEPMLRVLLDLRQGARASGDYAAADAIRDRLSDLGIELTDSADGSTGYRLPG